MLTKSSIAVLLFLCVVGVFFCSACTRRPDVIRPDGVSIDAVFVRGAKIGWWQQCTPAKADQAVHCRIWNGAGLVHL